MQKKWRCLLTLGVLGFWGVTQSASAQELCGAEEKEQVAALLSQFEDPTSDEALKMQKELYEQFYYCLDGAEWDQEGLRKLKAHACGEVSLLGNLGFERMPCCGYDPQERTFGCPIEILRETGFGAAPFPGSNEHVLVCVDLGNGFEPVARDLVHLADNISPAGPVWNFAALPKVFNQAFEARHFDSDTYRARAILSWNLAPLNCTNRPIWGNAIDFKIRLDP